MKMTWVKAIARIPSQEYGVFQEFLRPTVVFGSYHIPRPKRRIGYCTIDCRTCNAKRVLRVRGELLSGIEEHGVM